MPAGTLYSNGFLDSDDVSYNFAAGIEAGREQLWVPRLAFSNPTDKETETLNWLGQVPTMRKWLGGRHEQVVNKYTLTIKNYPYESTLAYSIDDLRRDKSGLLMAKVRDMGVRAMTHWNSLGSELIDTATSGTNGLAYDGQFFFDTDHAESGSNQSNDLTATEIPSANVATAAAPTATEAANIINEVMGYAMTLTDDQGEPINQDVSGGVIVTSKHTIYSAFRQAVSLASLVGGATNPITAVGGTWDVRLNTRLTADNAVRFFLDGGETDRPLIIQEEQPLTSRFVGAGSEEEFKHRRHLFGVDAVRGIGYGRWQRAFYVALS